MLGLDRERSSWVNTEMNEVPRPKLPEEISRYYQEIAEEGRLSAGSGQLECERTKEVVQRFLPPPPATILDVGGAAGAYALWLAENGYQVHLIDATPRLVAEASRRSEASRPLSPRLARIVLSSDSSSSAESMGNFRRTYVRSAAETHQYIRRARSAPRSGRRSSGFW